jgi:sec-independent protein translocase protein TatB
VFGSLGGSEVIFIFILALLLFGPRKLPEIGRTLGKAMGEFRKATQDFRMSLEREVEMDKLKEATRGVEDTMRQTFSRSAILDGPSVPVAPAAPTANEEPAPADPVQNAPTPGAPAPPSSEDAAGTAPEKPAPDGGSSTVH